MAQIGEFAFIVATLGLSLGVISDFLFPVAVGASAVTTFTTPYFIKYAEPIYHFISKYLPKKWVTRLNNYSVGTQSIQAESDWKLVLNSYIKIALTNGIILLSSVLLSINFLVPFVEQNVANGFLRIVIVLVISLSIAAPFLWAFMAKRPNNQSYKEMWLEKRYNRGPLLIIEILRNLLGISFIAFWVYWMIPTPIAILVTVPLTIFILFVFSRRIGKVYQRIEKGFLTNLNARAIAEGDDKSFERNIQRRNAEIQTNMEPWDAHIVEMVISPNAEYVGKTLMELGWREKYGINFVYIKRGDKLIHVPGRASRLMPFDRVGIIATDTQIQTLKPILESVDANVHENVGADDISLQKLIVDEHTKFKGMDIRSLGLHERINGLVVGIERKGERILNPDSTLKLEWGDIMWIVGDKKKIQQLFKNGNQTNFHVD
jgi:CPA2 family monovalent cation:H+ antiporter-2